MSLAQITRNAVAVALSLIAAPSVAAQLGDAISPEDNDSGDYVKLDLDSGDWTADDVTIKVNGNTLKEGEDYSIKDGESTSTPEIQFDQIYDETDSVILNIDESADVASLAPSRSRTRQVSDRHIQTRRWTWATHTSRT